MAENNLDAVQVDKVKVVKNILLNICFDIGIEAAVVSIHSGATGVVDFRLETPGMDEETWLMVQSRLDELRRYCQRHEIAAEDLILEIKGWRQ